MLMKLLFIANLNRNNYVRQKGSFENYLKNEQYLFALNNEMLFVLLHQEV